MKIAICDDIYKDSMWTKTLVEEYCQRAMLEVEIDVYSSGEDLLAHIEPAAYSLYLLDIYMEPVNGLEAAKTIRQKDKDGEIVFTTTSPDFALSGYEVQAIGYLIKPLTKAALEPLLDRYIHRFLHSARYIMAKCDRQDVKILRRAIRYAEIYGKRTIVHSLHGEYHIWTSLDELEKLLDGAPFLRCHRSYIVNMQFIDHIDGSDFILDDGMRVPFPSHEIIHYRTLWQDFVFVEAKERLYAKL